MPSGQPASSGVGAELSTAFLRYGTATDVGRVRDTNQDYLEVVTLADGGLLCVVCDGMGGHSGGEIASRLAVQTIRRCLAETPALAPTSESLGSELVWNPVAFSQAFQAAQRAVVERSASSDEEDLEGMGTTCVVAHVMPNRVVWAYVGDSRLYLLRDGQIHQLTRDHSRVQQMIDSGILDEEQAAVHPMRNIITKAIGVQGGDDPGMGELRVRPGDRLVICSDGLHGEVEDLDVCRTALATEPVVAARTLVGLANDRGGNDNITVVVVEAAVELSTSSVSPDPIQPWAVRPGPVGNRTRNLTLGALAVAIVVALLLFVVRNVLFPGDSRVDLEVSAGETGVVAAEGVEPAPGMARTGGDVAAREAGAGVAAGDMRGATEASGVSTPRLLKRSAVAGATADPSGPPRVDEGVASPARARAGQSSFEAGASEPPGGKESRSDE